MILTIAIFLLSAIPSVLIIIWMMKRKKDDALYKKSCTYALVGGLISVLPILVVSMVLSITNDLLKATVLKNMSDLAYKAIYTFIVLALAEEAIKYLVFRLTLSKKYNPYTWTDVVAFMVITGTAFALVEDVFYAINTSIIEILVRGIVMGHTGYAFIMGWFYGKMLHSGKKIYGVLALVLPFLLHGLYDFSLSPELWAINDDLKLVGVALAVADIVLVVLMVRFFIRAKKIEKYNTPLLPSP